jgi:hypothetical protein
MRRSLGQILAAVAVAAGGLTQSVAFADGPTTVGGRPVVVKSYDVPTGNAAEVAKTLQNRFGSSAIILPVGNKSILVYASPEDQVRIGGARGCAPPEKPIKTESIDVGAHIPADLVLRLRALLDGRSLSNLAIEPDPDNNAVIVRGPAELVAEVKAVIQVLRPVAGARR